MAEITREDAGALIPEDAASEIIKGALSQSAVLQLARERPRLARGQQRVPVQNTKPKAYFVNGDTGLKNVTDMSWRNVYFNVEEIAVIVPVSDNVVADNDYDLVEQLMPDIQEAFGAKIDNAVINGIDKPSSWPASLVAGAAAASQAVERGSGADLYDEILGEGGVFSLVEEDGFPVSGSVAAIRLKAALRALRTSEGLPIFSQTMQEANNYTLDGAPIYFPTNGSMDPATALMVCGDWSQLHYAWRADISMKVADQAVLTDPAGNVLFNLFQQDAIAYRFVARLAFALPNPVTLMNENDATRYPFATLIPDQTP